MRRGALTELPSGEAVARAMGLNPLEPVQIGLGDSWQAAAIETPLWYYIAREADIVGDGDRLGAVGGRIVAGVLLSLLDRDPASYRSLESTWTPELNLSGDPSQDDLFSILTLLNFGT
jgi:hypothetical protein